jgi:hypothetical protein
MNPMENIFTAKIEQILLANFGDKASALLENSLLIKYINYKAKSANRGSKSRGSFANIYAIYILVEDYVNHDFHIKGDYTQYQGALFSQLFKRQRELPFGEKLQNHALNNRLNGEFRKLFPMSDLIPISRIAESERYWINQNLLKVDGIDISLCLLKIIEEYIKTKKTSFDLFLKECEVLKTISKDAPYKAIAFVNTLLKPAVDARLFEIVSYSILKYHYIDQKIYWGTELNIELLKEEPLLLYKTGRTNANDGGIDFVMRPLGRFFQVTESIDFKKYFLDIDKIQKYPITFVIKSDENAEVLLSKIYTNASKFYTAKAVVDRYMSCIEELINLPSLTSIFRNAISKGYLEKILAEIVAQSKVEFNAYDDTIDE